MVEAIISGRVLRWARERSYQTLDTAAEKLRIKAEKLAEWEEEISR